MLLLHATDGHKCFDTESAHMSTVRRACATRRCMHCTATAVQIWACWAAQEMTLSSVSNCKTSVVGDML